MWSYLRKINSGSYFPPSSFPCSFLFLFFLVPSVNSSLDIMFRRAVIQVSGLRNNGNLTKSSCETPKPIVVKRMPFRISFSTFLPLPLSTTTTSTSFKGQYINFLIISPHSSHGLIGLFFHFQPNALFYLPFSYDYLPILTYGVSSPLLKLDYSVFDLEESLFRPSA